MTKTRLASALIACHALLCACWLGLARTVAPAVVADAYRGRSLSALNRVFQRQVPHPLGHYLTLWSDFADAVALGIVLHLALVLLGLRLNPRPGGEVWGLGKLSAFSASFLLLTILSGPRHDYVAFVEIWEAMRQGETPWYVSKHLGYALNAYGPLFNALAPLAWWNPLAPKLLFSSAYLAYVVVFLARPPEASGQGDPCRRATIWLVGPFCWVEVAYFGHFDVLVAILCVLAVSCRRRDRDAASGMALGAGFLLKFLPLAILPFLGIDCLRVRARLLGAALVVMAAGMTIGFLTWGPSVFGPLGFARTRASSLASIFRFLRGTYSPLRLFTDAPDLDRYSTLAMVVAGAAVFLVCQVRKTAPETSAVVSVLTALMFYQVGFLQYQVLLFLLLVDWRRTHGALLSGRPVLSRIIDAYLAWFTVFDLVYAYAGGVLHPGDPLAWLDEVAGLPTFALSLALLLGMLSTTTDRGVRSLRPSAGDGIAAKKGVNSGRPESASTGPHDGGETEAAR